MRFDSIENDPLNNAGTGMYTIREVPEEPVVDTRCCCLRWLGIGTAREQRESTKSSLEKNSSLQRSESGGSRVPLLGAQGGCATESVLSSEIPPLFWWKYEMVHRMQPLKEAWAVKMMSEINTVDYATAEPYQKEVQFMVENFKNMQESKKNKES